MADASRKPDSDDGKGDGSKEVVCPQCKARYAPRHETRGRRVRCRHCGHVWRDWAGDVDAVSAALGPAAAGWAQLGSTILAAGDHASTMGHLAGEMIGPRHPAPHAWVGKKLGRYEIRSVLGQGAMGYVYEAEDRDLRRRVALKVLPRVIEAGHEPIGLRMFLQEARVAARLQHANVVTVFEIGQEEGTYYFSMELVHGTTLGRLVEAKGPLGAGQACYIIAQAARGLAAGHAMGIVHRDVKPGNIMIDTAGQVKVTDFGLADVEGIEGIAELRERALGTPGWISPEVARGGRASPSSDIYGLGLTLFFAMSGERLVHAETKSGMIRKQREATSVGMDRMPEAWPPRLKEIVVQCLQAEARDRYQSAEALAVDLMRSLRPGSSDGTMSLVDRSSPAGAKRRIPRVIAWLVVSLLMLLGSVIAAWWFVGREF